MDWFKYLAVCLLLASPPAQGTISVQFSDGSNSLNMLEDSSGTGPTNELLWGILIDTNNDGFGPFSSDTDKTVVLNDGVELAPGDVFVAGGTTINFMFGSDPGAGAVTAAASIDPYVFPGVAANQAFAIVWFDTGISMGDTLPFGSLYGILTKPALTLPSDGTGLVSYSSEFAGTDPARPTNQITSASIPASTTSKVVTVDPGGSNTQNMAFEFPVSVINDDSGALTYKLWKSTDLTNWSVATMTPGIVSDDGTTRVLQLVDPDPVGADPSGKRFLRLEITP